MASMTIRNLDDSLKQRLRLRAAAHGRSMEDEARDILRVALSTSERQPGNLAAAIRARIASTGGITLEVRHARRPAKRRTFPGDHPRHQRAVGIADTGAVGHRRGVARRAAADVGVHHDRDRSGDPLRTAAAAGWTPPARPRGGDRADPPRGFCRAHIAIRQRGSERLCQAGRGAAQARPPYQPVRRTNCRDRSFTRRSLAARNVADFEGTGIALISPWDHQLS